MMMYMLLAFVYISSVMAFDDDFFDDFFQIRTEAPSPKIFKPSHGPSFEPSSNPSLQPTSIPSSQPTISHSFEPTSRPSPKPSSNPTSIPSSKPSLTKSFEPSFATSESPSLSPALRSSTKPSIKQSFKPSISSSFIPSSGPTWVQTFNPSSIPSFSPNNSPSSFPSSRPSTRPSQIPTSIQSLEPSIAQTKAPVKTPINRRSSCPIIKFMGTAFRFSVGFRDGNNYCVLIELFEGGEFAVERHHGSNCYDENFFPSNRLSVYDKIVGYKAHFIGEGMTWRGQFSISEDPKLNEADLKIKTWNEESRKYDIKILLPTCSSPYDSSTPSLSPSAAHSLLPSVSPSIQPVHSSTETPTITPSHTLSTSPTNESSNMPSMPPSKLPSISPTKEPTQEPSPTPTKEPTKEPSLPPTKEPTNVPSSPPTQVQPTSGPSKNVQTRPPALRRIYTSSSPSLKPSRLISPQKDYPCRISQSGSYGNKTAKNLKFIQYKYQIEYDMSSSIKQFMQGVERRISNSVINFSSLFPECTQMRSAGMSPPSRNQGGGDNMLGLSSNPADETTSEGCPFDKISESNNCTVVDGVLTLYYDDEQSVDLSIKEIHGVIQAVLLDKKLIEGNVGIENVKYIPRAIEEQNDKAASSRTDLNRIVTISFGSLSGFIVLLVLLYFLKKQLKRRGDQQLIVQGEGSNVSSLHTNWKRRRPRAVSSTSASDIYTNYYDDSSLCSNESNTFIDSTRTVSNVTWKTSNDWG